MLERGGGRQHVVGHLCRGRHDELQHDNELHDLKRSAHQLGVGVGNERVCRIHYKGAHAVGLFLDGGLPHALRQDARQIAHGQMPAELCRARIGQLPAPITLQAAVRFV